VKVKKTLDDGDSRKRTVVKKITIEKKNSEREAVVQDTL
jgi:hypothetical protein